MYTCIHVCIYIYIYIYIYIKFTYGYSDERVSFLDLQVDIMESKLITSLFVKPTDQHNTFTIRQVILSTLNGP